MSESLPGYEEPTYTIASASVKLTKNRGLMFYAVSLFNPLHRAANLHASMDVIKELVHPEKPWLNLVIHITDAIYAFNYMIEDPGLSYEGAKAVARAAGNEWANDNMTHIIDEVGFQPVVFNWSQWQDKRSTEYLKALAQLQELQSHENDNFREFQIAVDADVERFVDLTIQRRQQKDTQTDATERERIRSLCMQFVLHEASGYILIGRHIVDDYMNILRNKYPDLALVIDSDGGLIDGAFRLYPGRQLKCIEWLQRSRNKLPQSLWGAEGVSPVRIDLTHTSASNEDLFKTPADIFLSQQFRKLKKPQP